MGSVSLPTPSTAARRTTGCIALWTPGERGRQVNACTTTPPAATNGDEAVSPYWSSGAQVPSCASVCCA